MSYAKSLLIWMVITGSVLPLMAQQPTKPWSVLNDKKRSVILDTDIGNDIDDVLALDMLMKYIDDGKVDLLGVMNNKNSEYATRFLDLLLTWYGHSDIPIGKITDGPLLEGYGDYAKSIVEMNDSSGVIYPYSVTQHDTLMESHKLYRKLLATQPDQSVMVISIGFSTNLQRLLQSGPDEYSDLNGKELVAKKVYGLSLMGGSFGRNKRNEFNIIHDIDAAQEVFTTWPSPIVISPFEVGASIYYPAESIATDFGWADQHPLIDAYKHYRPFPYDRPTWDLTSVYYAVDGDMDLLNVSVPGVLTVDDEGYMHF